MSRREDGYHQDIQGEGANKSIFNLNQRTECTQVQKTTLVIAEERYTATCLWPGAKRNRSLTTRTLIDLCRADDLALQRRAELQGL